MRKRWLQNASSSNSVLPKKVKLYKHFQIKTFPVVCSTADKLFEKWVPLQIHPCITVVYDVTSNSFDNHLSGKRRFLFCVSVLFVCIWLGFVWVLVYIDMHISRVQHQQIFFYTHFRKLLKIYFCFNFETFPELYSKRYDSSKFILQSLRNFATFM